MATDQHENIEYIRVVVNNTENISTMNTCLKWTATVLFIIFGIVVVTGLYYIPQDTCFHIGSSCKVCLKPENEPFISSCQIDYFTSSCPTEKLEPKENNISCIQPDLPFCVDIKNVFWRDGDNYITIDLKETQYQDNIRECIHFVFLIAHGDIDESEYIYVPLLKKVRDDPIPKSNYKFLTSLSTNPLTKDTVFDLYKYWFDRLNEQNERLIVTGNKKVPCEQHKTNEEKEVTNYNTPIKWCDFDKTDEENAGCASDMVAHVSRNPDLEEWMKLELEEVKEKEKEAQLSTFDRIVYEILKIQKKLVETVQNMTARITN